jgi:arsenite-transporting ATPase
VRILLFTGKGGVGKTTLAAGTAALAAERGRKTLVLSADAAHSLGDVLAADVGPEPTEVAGGLYAQQVDSRRRLERSWGEIQRYLRHVLSSAGVDPVQAEELTMLPGAEEVLALLGLREQVADGRWDVVVVDCAPTAETLRLLALPDALGWYMRRALPVERRIVRALRPVVGRRSGVPMPEDDVLDALQRLHRELAEVRDVLTGPHASVRLVLTPESVVVAEARRTLTSLSLYGYRVDAVVANRVVPAGGDSWRDRWAAAQAEQLDAVRASVQPLPVHVVRYGDAEPVGAERLAGLAAETYGDLDPFADAEVAPPVTVDRSGDEFVLALALPLADRAVTDLSRVGDDLVVTVGAHRRVHALPAALRRCTVAGATLRDGVLRVRFEPDPDLWRPL